jgi:hypothetical protein
MQCRGKADRFVPEKWRAHDLLSGIETKPDFVANQNAIGQLSLADVLHLIRQ